MKSPMRREFALPTNRKKSRLDSYRLGLAEVLHASDVGFKCLHCHQDISVAVSLSGVNNRNHCPYCLWSRHLDLHTAGDRLAACKEKMQPIGLTLKHARNKYAQTAQGELMLIHRCIECQQVSINRIAADDDARTIMEVLYASFDLDASTRERLEQQGIQVLAARHAQMVQMQLLGCAA